MNMPHFWMHPRMKSALAFLTAKKITHFIPPPQHSLPPVHSMAVVALKICWLFTSLPLISIFWLLATAQAHLSFSAQRCRISPISCGDFFLADLGFMSEQEHNFEWFAVAHTCPRAVICFFSVVQAQWGFLRGVQAPGNTAKWSGSENP